MSSADPGGVDHVPTSTLVECTVCHGNVTLLPGGIVRRHLDPNLGPELPRAERVCPGSRGRWNWKAIDRGRG